MTHLSLFQLVIFGVVGIALGSCASKRPPAQVVTESREWEVKEDVACERINAGKVTASVALDPAVKERVISVSARVKEGSISPDTRLKVGKAKGGMS